MDVDREGLFVEIFNSVVILLIAIESNFDRWNYADVFAQLRQIIDVTRDTS